MKYIQENFVDLNKKRCQNCYIIGPTGPRGEIGPTGPTGPASAQTTSVYGSKYDTSANNIELTANTNSTIPLATTGPVSGINSDVVNSFKIIDSGIYKIDYLFQGSSSAIASLTLEVINNTNPISSSTITKDINANKEETLSGSIITSLTTDDEISLGLESSVTATISPANGTSAYLNIIKVS